jgi:hypothetical protein
MQFSELQKIEMQLGYTGGIVIGALGAWVFIVFFVSWEWWWKVLSTIGEIGIVGNLLIAIGELRKQRKGLIEVMKEMGIERKNWGKTDKSEKIEKKEEEIREIPKEESMETLLNKNDLKIINYAKKYPENWDKICETIKLERKNGK